MKRYRVLVIEDNEQNLYLMQFLLERHGFVVITARSGREGLELAETEVPDLILLDIQLPEMDGYTVATELRKRPALHEVPIVAVTSYAMLGDREKALSSGATDYIEKPIDPTTFVGRISVHLHHQAGGTSEEAYAEPTKVTDDTRE